MAKATVLAGEASSRDPAVGLAAVAALATLLESLEELQVLSARDAGWSWQEIATVLGVSKQAVHKKYGGSRRLLGKVR
ncbi:MAG: helix-turn-helix domain-containing protein [Mycobacteriales bacterium]